MPMLRLSPFCCLPRFFRLLLFVPLLLLIESPAKAQEKWPIYRYEIRVMAGEMQERFSQFDPAQRLSKANRFHGFFGLQFFRHLDAASRVGLQYRRLVIGRSAIFPEPDYVPFISVDPNFNELALLYERDLFSIGPRKALHVFAAAGPAFNFTGFPDARGSSSNTVFASNGNDTLYHIRDTFAYYRSQFFSLTGTLGLRYQLSQRIQLSLAASYAHNLGGPVSWSEVSYLHPGESGRRNAFIETSGDTSALAVSLHYRMGKKKSGARPGR